MGDNKQTEVRRTRRSERYTSEGPEPTASMKTDPGATAQPPLKGNARRTTKSVPAQEAAGMTGPLMRPAFDRTNNGTTGAQPVRRQTATRGTTMQPNTNLNANGMTRTQSGMDQTGTGMRPAQMGMNQTGMRPAQMGMNQTGTGMRPAQMGMNQTGTQMMPARTGTTRNGTGNPPSRTGSNPNGLQSGYRPENPEPVMNGYYPSSAPQSDWQNGFVSQREVRQQQAAMQQYYAQQQYYANAQKSWKENTGTFQQDGTQRGFVPQQTLSGIPNASAKPPKKTFSFRKLIPWLIALIVIGGLVCSWFYVITPAMRAKKIEEAVTPFDNVYCNGVYVDEIHLGGMTPEQAKAAVTSQIQQRNDAWKVDLTYEGQPIASITADMLGMKVDVDTVLREAWKPGHTTSNGNSQTYEERLHAMNVLAVAPYKAYTATPSGDTSVIDQMLNSIKAQVDYPAQDAMVVEFNTTLSYPFVFKDEVYGRNLNTEPIKKQLYEMVSVMKSGSVDLRPDIVEPNVKLVDLKKDFELRSSVYTNISTSSTENRNENIRVAFSKFNGMKLEPGQKFSFNSVVGERTLNNGFKTATEYVYGDHVEGVGGGVCQASSTLYRAAVCAGLQIVEREPHSDAVNYCDYGMDATVYWVGKRKIDLVFKNDTEKPVYIVANVQTDPGNKKRLIAKVSIYGQYMEGVRYDMESKIVEVIDPPTKPTYVKDTEGTYVTYTDQQQSVSKAQEGYIVESYRVQYNGNEVVGKKLLYTDEYPPKAERIYVGVKDRK